MKKVRDVIGIDVSKKTIDATLYNSRQHAVFSNDEEGYKELIRLIKRHLETSEYFFCFENTGNYSLKLSVFLSSLSLIYVEESPMRIKRSTGLAREKTDKLDSYMIARFGWMYREELEPSNVKPKEFQEIGRLLALRDQMVRDRSGLKSTLKEQKHLLSSRSTAPCCKILERSIKYIDKQVLSIEKRMKELLKTDDKLQHNYELLRTVKGVGLILSCQLLYHTSNFMKFNNWRSFSSYCGIAPFEYSSGSSIRRRKQSHYIGDRKMKTLLSMAAVSAIQSDQELKNYYHRKLEEGKHKMIALNNVRNKILARSFAVIKRGTLFVNIAAVNF
ncbi:IS110 family transposase [uncultured Tenacibaculum sp.]|uniref:IS110 family transposase n=1 Tax=uncultured Tenacibaculum sp. TaxID=174713 RepID=UPI00260F5F07|nr:IS110 family transposase [uncultured Tenacibaculum sp.]